ncbi:hypothetical protein Hanom_Chr12g01076851 [Helianthus anomalus]
MTCLLIFVNFRLSHSVPVEKMIVLDLFADVKPYGNHHLNSIARRPLYMVTSSSKYKSLLAYKLFNGL